jgi:hypothetical protein
MGIGMWPSGLRGAPWRRGAPGIALWGALLALAGLPAFFASAATAANAAPRAGIRARLGVPGAQAPLAASWAPPAQLSWFWQLQGKVSNGHAVGAYDIDGFENSAAEVAALHEQGKHVICYIDVGTAENFRPDYSSFPASVLGHSNGWPGERWIDIRQLSVIEPIMARRFEMCLEKGFDAVEPDNIEAYENNSGFPITAEQQLAYNEWVAEAVHSLGMAVLQKNDGPQTVEQEPLFDGALTEQCNQYSECADFKPYVTAGKPVLNAEYHRPPRKFCAADAALGFMGARFNVALNGRRFEPCS